MTRTLSFATKNGTLLYWVTMLFYTLLPIILIERMVLDVDELTKVVFPYYRLLSLVVCVLYLLVLCYNKSLYIDTLSAILFAFMMVGLTKGLFGGFNSSYLFTHISAGLITFTFYLAGRQSYIEADRLHYYLKVCSYFIFIEYSIITLTAYLAYHYSGLLMTERFHLSLNIAPILVSFVFFLVEGNYKLNIVTILVIFLSGKRSLLVAAVSMYLIYFWLAGNRNRSVLLKKSLSAVTLLGICGLIFIFYAGGVSFMELALRRVLSLNILSAGVDIDTVSSGRWNEFMAVFDNITSSFQNFILGNGYGNFIEIIYQSDYDFTMQYMQKIGFDMFPVHFLYLYGFIATTLIMFCIVNLLVRSCNYVKIGCRKSDNIQTIVRLMLFMIVSSIFINSLFTFINPDPFLWFTFGLLCSTNMKQSYMRIPMQPVNLF